MYLLTYRLMPEGSLTEIKPSQKLRSYLPAKKNIAILNLASYFQASLHNGYVRLVCGTSRAVKHSPK